MSFAKSIVMERIYVDTSVFEQLRDIRDKVSAETQNMAFAELKQYIDKHLNSTSLHSNAVWH
ncbi:hypothetical protein AGMMS49982_05840 [Bacteroidia bacterium]|nr:hypothetical protein AGMMS49982_05840 [Bacteroidia bacterium]